MYVHTQAHTHIHSACVHAHVHRAFTQKHSQALCRVICTCPACTHTRRCAHTHTARTHKHKHVCTQHTHTSHSYPQAPCAHTRLCMHTCTPTHVYTHIHMHTHACTSRARTPTCSQRPWQSWWQPGLLPQGCPSPCPLGPPSPRAPHLHLVRRFWNQVFTWASVILRALARAARSAEARYFCRWKRFSSSQICRRVKEVRGFFFLGGVRFW